MIANLVASLTDLITAPVIKYVAMTYTTAAASSVDGITWTARTLPSSSTWRSAVWGTDKFVVVGYGTAIAATSPDGITWTSRTLSATKDWIGLAYGGGVFAAVAGSSNSVGTS